MVLEEVPEGAVVELNLILPVDDKTCRQQIDANMRLKIPEAIRRRSLTVIANGPSARHVNLANIKGPTLALNGSIRLFIEQNVSPTYWAACDPQALVADFLPNYPPLETVYFVAGKCHPSVLEKLKHRVVRLWHVGDHKTEDRWHIASSASVTITACWLMNRLGYTDFEFWGWDGCFMDGRHHAVGDEDFSAVPSVKLNYGGKIEDGKMVGGREFSTTRTWAAEAKAADQFFQLVEYFDIGIKINGDGMFAHAQQFIKAA